MIPKTQGLLREPIEIVEEPSYTYRLDLNSNIISGMTDGLEAVKQAVYHRIGIERYQYPIYSWEYGLQTYDLYGKPMPYVMPELKRRIIEALLKEPHHEGGRLFFYPGGGKTAHNLSSAKPTGRVSGRSCADGKRGDFRECLKVLQSR